MPAQPAAAQQQHLAIVAQAPWDPVQWATRAMVTDEVNRVREILGNIQAHVDRLSHLGERLGRAIDVIDQRLRVIETWNGMQDAPELERR